MSVENEIRNIKLFEEEIRNIKQMAFDAAHPVNETYTQYPQQDDPMTLYNKDGVTSVWEIQAQYSGAFFRSSNAPDAVYKADDEDQYYTRDSVTGGLVPTNVAANGGPSISPTPSGTPITIEGKTYYSYAVTASSRNAADYIIKTNSLVLQESENKEHNHRFNHHHYSSGATSGYGGYLNGVITRKFSSNMDVSDIGDAGAPTGSGGLTLNRYYINMNHSHSFGAWSGNPYNSSNTAEKLNTDSEGGEGRPNNFTSIIWKRIS